MHNLTWEEIGLELRRHIDLPHRGLRELADLRATLARVERELVIAARHNQSSWAEIGFSLGISRQAARARHRPFVSPAAGDSPRPFG